MISVQAYRPPWYLFNGHLETIFPFWSDKIETPAYQTEILELEDGDFLELDWLKSGSERLMILCHGLEGNSRSHYVKRAANYFSGKGWDILAWNFRSCGRKPNKSPQFYHAGKTDDLEQVVLHVAADYDSLVLCGFSIGGSMAINYCGGASTPNNLRALLGISVPLDFGETITQLDKWGNRIYQRKFISKLKRKVRDKVLAYPEAFGQGNLANIQNLRDFTEQITAPVHGYDLNGFQESNNCLDALEKISIPTLIVNALNDPFLGPNSYPDRVSNPLIRTEFPKNGGHAGFTVLGKKESWVECRMEEFLAGVVRKIHSYAYLTLTISIAPSLL